MRGPEIYTSFKIVKKWDISTMTVCCCFNSLIETSKYISEYSNENGKKQFYNCANIYITVKYQAKMEMFSWREFLTRIRRHML